MAELFDTSPAAGGEYIKIKAPHLYLGNRRLEVGEVVPVSEVSAGVAVAWVAVGRADWRKTAGDDAPKKEG